MLGLRMEKALASQHAPQGTPATNCSPFHFSILIPPQKSTHPAFPSWRLCHPPTHAELPSLRGASVQGQEWLELLCPKRPACQVWTHTCHECIDTNNDPAAVKPHGCERGFAVPVSLPLLARDCVSTQGWSDTASLESRLRQYGHNSEVPSSDALARSRSWSPQSMSSSLSAAAIVWSDCIVVSGSSPVSYARRSIATAPR